LDQKKRHRIIEILPQGGGWFRIHKFQVRSSNNAGYKSNKGMKWEKGGTKELRQYTGKRSRTTIGGLPGRPHESSGASWEETRSCEKGNGIGIMEPTIKMKGAGEKISIRIGQVRLGGAASLLGHQRGKIRERRWENRISREKEDE